jgi:hypothetical protein
MAMMRATDAVDDPRWPCVPGSGWFGLGTDYPLLLISCYRDELRRHPEPA